MKRLGGYFTPLFLFLFVFTTCLHVGQIIHAKETIIKSVGGGYFGEFGPANHTMMNSYSVFAQSNGDIYFADYTYCRVRKISNGLISTIAGNGICGYGGDGGLATTANLKSPSAVGFDSRGDLYIVDSGNNRIRKVSGGIISTIAGSTIGFSGDGGLATNAQFNTPTAIVISPTTDEIYISDTSNHRIRKILNGNISTIAGTSGSGFNYDNVTATSSKLNYPKDLLLGSNGELYIADASNNRIRMVSKDGIITTIAGTGALGSTGDGGPATLCNLNSPTGIAFNSNGELLIADRYNHRIRKIAKDGIITTIAGNATSGYSGDGGLATNAVLNSPCGLSVFSNGDYVFTDGNSAKVRKITVDGVISTIAGFQELVYGDGGLATKSWISTPYDVVVLSNGDVYISETGTNRIRKISNGTITTIAGTGVPEFNGDGILATDASLKVPKGIAVRENGEVLIADSLNNRIRKISTNGTISTVAGIGTSGSNNPNGMAATSQISMPYSVTLGLGLDIYFADTGNHLIRKVSGDGTITTIAGGGTGVDGLATSAQLKNPAGIAVSAKGEVYIADTNNHKIRKVSGAIMSTIAGTGAAGFGGDGGLATNAVLNYPYGIVLASNGDIIFSDRINHRIRKISTDGIISTIAGTGTAGIEGNGGDPLKAQLYQPAGLAIDSKGDLYITEVMNNIVRVITTVDSVCNGITSSNASVCNGNGTCVKNENCTCNPNYLGTYCEVPICFGKLANSSNVCNNNGKCNFADNCNCNNGWYGTECSISHCNGTESTSPHVCNSIGKCVGPDTCQCFEGFSGSNCEIPICYGNLANETEDVCSGQGQCISNNTCQCTEGWFGSNCELPSCFGIMANETAKVCSGQGNCISKNTCNCKNGRGGSYCEESPICYGKMANDTQNVCSGHGQCVSNNTCNCINGWKGSNCEIPICYEKLANDSTVCSGQGQCIFNNTCQCFEGFTGSNCSTPICFGIMANDTQNVCSSRGQCVSNNTCQCSEGFTGARCEIPICYGKMANDTQNVCSGNGQCILNNSCNCLNGWKGSNCEIPICYGKLANESTVCSVHGQCISNNSCQCTNNWTGSMCEIPICYGKLANDTKNVCSGHGDCALNNTCQCNEGFTGSRCEIPICYGKLANDTLNTCSGNGQCISNNSCSCLDGWKGARCEIPICFGNLANDTQHVCSGHGQCISNNSCQCSGGWSGESCALVTCFTIPENDKRVCSGRGTCDGIDTCKCQDSWTGLQCEQFTCFGLLPNNTEVCNNGNGTCSSNNTCSCEKGWIGNRCEIRTCFNISERDPLVCAGHGFCKKIDSCECENGWTGLNCSIPICFGISSSNSLVCSAHGDCISNNTCQCKDSWVGNECQLAVCDGELSTSKTVCSSHGSCVAPNTCKCNQGWGGFNCSQPYCFNVISVDNRVCSSHGSCQDVDSCVCDPKWKGLQCSVHTCYGLEFNSTNICNGHGSCTAVDSCKCDLGWSGQDCSFLSCNQVPQNSPSACSGHGNCSSMDNCTCQNGYQGKWCDLYNCYGNWIPISTVCEKPQCSSLLNCSGHGECDINGQCICYSNSSKGYWKNETCNQCQENYFGKDCATMLKGPVRFKDDFSGITFNLQGNLQADQTIECSLIIPSVEMYLFGVDSKPVCNWIHSSTQFNIKFGEGYQLTPNKLIHLNMLVFDSVNSSENLISTIVLGPLNPIAPTAQISQTRSEYGSCEEIIVDGSSSYSTDRKSLIYIWNISHVSYNVLQTTNVSFVTLPSSVPSGDYFIGLKVISTLSGLESKVYQVSFTKKQVSFPVVSIVGGSYSSFVVTQVPIVIGTIITLPDCISNSSNSLVYKWEKINGPELTMISNSKDLVITDFTQKTKQTYSFKLTVTSVEIVGMSTSTMAYLNTTLEPFNTILYVSDLTTDKAVIGAEFSTSLDLSMETFKWSCQDTVTKLSCDSSINTALDQFSLSKSTTITIPSTKQNLTLVLQVRDVTSTIDIVFPTSKNIAPLINLLMVTPSDRTIVASKESLNLQLSVSINGVEEGIDSKLERIWTLNGGSIPNTYVSSMKTELSNSNYIILDTSFLQKGADYSLEFKATNLDCGLSSVYSFKFSVAKPVPVCIPTSSLSAVYALETKLTLSLPNCNLETSMESKFYFVDPQSNAKIYLATGTQLTTLLPLSDLGSITLSAVITDKSSGESSESSVTVKTLVPLAASLTEVKLKQKAWVAQASRLLPGDPQKSVLNSGTISYVVQVMISKIAFKRRSSVSNCQHGTLNAITQECICSSGYAKLDCSISTEEWTERKELMDSLATMFTDSYNSRNKYEKVTETYLLSQLFSMKNLLRVYDELSSESVESLLNVLGELSTNSVNNKNLQAPNGVESLTMEVVNSLYGYRKLVLKEKLSSSKMNYLMNITLDMSNVLVRNKFIGGDSLNFKSEFIGITSNRIYPRDLSEYLLEQSNNTMIKLPNGMMKYLESSYSKRKPLTLRLTKTVNYIEPTSKDMEILSNLVTFEVLEIPLKNISERIDFRLEATSSGRRTSSRTTVCAMLLKGTSWDTSVCELASRNNSNIVDCLCSQQGTVSLLSLSTEQPIYINPTASSGNPPGTNTSRQGGLELLALLTLLVLVVIVCALIVLITCCIVRRKKKNKESTPPVNAKEMVNV